MRTLVIYDNSGFIVSQMSGDVREPVGLPFQWVDIPEGMRLVSIDPQTDNPIFEDVPKGEIELLREQIQMQAQAILELSMMVGGVM